tara:strand:+ start:279 stop:509 length:231 start_codon:yes stop_codon:yes gene_type:complete
MVNMDFKAFIKNPLSSILFLCIIAISYLYINNRTVYEAIIMKHETQIRDLKNELHLLREDYKLLNQKFIETLRDME